MLIDWFTVGAQALNFAILLLLLKRFLYGPILAAVARREERIAGQFAEAERRQREAGVEAEELRRRQNALEEERARSLEEAREEGRRRREELLAAARQEEERVREAWRESLRGEKERFVAEFKRRAGAEVLRAGRRAFADLAGEDLDRRVVEVFVGMIEALDEERRSAFRADAAREVLVTTATELATAQKRQISAAVHRAAGRELEVVYHTDPGLSPGIRLQVGGTRLAWSVDDYFDALERHLGEVLESAAGERRPEAPRP